MYEYCSDRNSISSTSTSTLDPQHFPSNHFFPVRTEKAVRRNFLIPPPPGYFVRIMRHGGLRLGGQVSHSHHQEKDHLLIRLTDGRDETAGDGYVHSPILHAPQYVERKEEEEEKEARLDLHSHAVFFSFIKEKSIRDLLKV